MKFFSTTAAAFFSVLGLVNANCDSGPFISNLAGVPFTSTPDHEHFCESPFDTGAIITGIRVWSAKFQIKSVQFQYSGGTWGNRYGSLPDDVTPEEKTWTDGDSIGLKLWNNKPDDGKPMDAVGKIVITQDGQKDFTAGGSKIDKELYVNNPSGKLIAVKGSAGAWISSLEFKFLESPITDTTMTSITYAQSMDQYNSKKQGLEGAALGDVYFKNSNPVGGLNATYSSSSLITKSVTKTITVSQTHTVGYSLSIKVSGKVGVPLLAESEVDVTNELSYSYANMKSDATADTDTWTFTWVMGGPSAGILPQTAAHCTASATMGTFQSAFTAKITATMANGKTFDYNASGQYQSVGYAHGIQDCKVVALKDVPSAAKVQEGTHKKRSSRLTRFIQA